MVMTVAYRRRGYDHMGAVLVDAGLQAGVSYVNVVAPRVRRLLAHWPSAATVTRFEEKRRRYGLAEVLRWRDEVKLERIAGLSRAFSANGVESVDDARYWLRDDASQSVLTTIHGIGPKTSAYLRILVGLDELAVDRHLRSFARSAGLSGSDVDIKHRLMGAADESGMSLADIDRSVFAAATGSPSDTATWRVSQLKAALSAYSGP